MASPSTVLTLGFGSWGSVNELPTLGFGVGAEAVTGGQRFCLKAVPGKAYELAALDSKILGLTATNDQCGVCCD